MSEIDPVKIPAYQRKRSIAAKARKKKVITPRKRPETNLTDIPIAPSLPTESFFKRSRTRKSESREMKICGRCEGYFDKIDVAVIGLTSAIRVGDQIIFETADGLFEQTLNSIQHDRQEIRIAGSGKEIGVKVPQAPKVGGLVYKVI